MTMMTTHTDLQQLSDAARTLLAEEEALLDATRAAIRRAAEARIAAPPSASATRAAAEALSSLRALEALFGAVVLACGGCATVDVAGRLGPGDPALASLRDERGQPVDLGAIARAHDATVLFFWATRCPCVARYQERMLALRGAHPSERVAMFAVVSNADDDLARAATVARSRGFTLPLVHDPGGRLARRLDARTTPTTVILDRDGATRFVGWIDNERPPGTRGRVAWAEEALGALLEGRSPPTARAPVYGCMITRSLVEPRACHGPQ